MKKYGLNADKLADTRVTGYRRNVLHPLLIGTVCALVGAWPVHAEDLVERGASCRRGPLLPFPHGPTGAACMAVIHGGVAAPSPAPPWTGIMVVFGHPEDFSQRQNTSFQAEGDFDLNGFAKLVGGQVGYNHQTGHVIWGLEGDMAWTGFNEGRVFKRGDNYVKAQMDWLATLRGRLGFGYRQWHGLCHRWSRNGKGGVIAPTSMRMARTQPVSTTNCPPALTKTLATQANKTSLKTSHGTGCSPGWWLVSGVEARISEHLSLKGEYLYLHLADKNLVYNSTNDADIDFGHNAHLFRLGLNVHLNPMALDGQDSVGLNGWNGFLRRHPRWRWCLHRHRHGLGP